MKENNKFNDDEVEILDFDDEIDDSKTSNTEKKEAPLVEEKKIEPKIDENIINNPKDQKQKKNISESKKDIVTHKKRFNFKALFLFIFVFGLLFTFVYFLPDISAYLKGEKDIDKSTNISKVEEIEAKQIEKSLSSLKNTVNYKFTNKLKYYTKDIDDEILILENNYIYEMTQNILKVETIKRISEISYDSIDYYQNENSNYYGYINDMTNNSYSKINIENTEFDDLQYILDNVITYIVDNNIKINEEKTEIDNKNYTLVKIKCPVDLLTNLSINTERIPNKIDVQKLELTNLEISLYFDDNNIEKIEFNVKDKNIGSAEDEIEYDTIISSYTFSDFGNIKDITIPNIQ